MLWSAFRALDGESSVPDMMRAAWEAYWKLTTSGERPMQVIPGGWLARTGENSAVFSREGLVIYGLTRETNLNWLAQQDEKIAAEWKRIYGFEA